MLLSLLKSTLPEDVLSSLQGKPQLGAEELRAGGIETAFDFNELVLRAHVQIEKLKANEVQLNNRTGGLNLENALRPNGLSHVFNLRGNQDFQFNQMPSPSVRNGRLPARMDIETATSLHRWIIETQSKWIEAPQLGIPEREPHGFHRQDMRLIYDSPTHMLRTAVGDLNYSVRHYQAFQTLGGISFGRNFLLQPYRVTFPTGSRELILQNPAQVTVWVNGVRYQTLFLDKGRHDLKSLAPTLGVNTVQLDIVDSYGRREKIEVSWVSDGDQLQKGLHEFAYNFGFPSDYDVRGVRHYNKKMPTTSAFHRIGVTDSFTVGAYYQGNHLQSTGGPEFLFATKLGTFALEPAASHVEGRGTRGASRLRYRYLDYKGPNHSQRFLNFGLESRHRQFTVFNQLSGYQSGRADASLSYGQLLFLGFSARAGGSIQVLRTEFGSQSDPYNSYDASFDLLKNFENSMQMSLNLTHRRDSVGKHLNTLFFLFSWAIPESTHFLSTSYATQNDTKHFDWRYNSRRIVNGVNTGLSYDNSDVERRGNMSVDYTGNRSQLSVFHTATQQEKTKVMQNSSIRLGTALVFADGVFAISRPVSDSFAIIHPTGAIRGETVRVNSNANDIYEAKTDWLGSAVLPGLRGYQAYPAFVDGSALKPGQVLGQENFTLLPRARSGVRVDIGTEARLILRGQLVNSKEEPITLETFEVYRVDDAVASPVLLFTDRKGKFEGEGLFPGNYELKVAEKWQRVRFVIPENTEMRFDLGKVLVKDAQ